MEENKEMYRCGFLNKLTKGEYEMYIQDPRAKENNQQEVMSFLMFAFTLENGKPVLIALDGPEEESDYSKYSKVGEYTEEEFKQSGGIILKRIREEIEIISQDKEFEKCDVSWEVLTQGLSENEICVLDRRGIVSIACQCLGNLMMDNRQ